MSDDEHHITDVSGTGVPIPGDDIDTDQILPACFMTELTFDNMTEYLFYDARRDDDGAFNDHPLNHFEGASVAVVNSTSGGVPDEVDVSIGVKTDSSDFTASVKNVTINGSTPAGGGSLSASDKREYQMYANRDSEGSGNGTLVVQFTARFEGSQNSPSNQDIIDVHSGDMNA